jgi:hypothetical protein
MSDQVIFTKEEVEKIRDVILSLKSELFLKVSNAHGPEIAYNYPEVEYARNGIALLDSPRPRPKVSLNMIDSIAGSCYRIDGETLHNYKVRLTTYTERFGFDVED